MSEAVQASCHDYPPGGLRGDFLRALAGAALCGLPLMVAPIHPIATAVLGGLTLVFAVFGVRTWLRTRETIVMDDTGLTAGVLYRRHVAWHELGRFKLRYFSTRRDRSGGWMQLVLRGKGMSVAIDSEIEGFIDICRRAHDAARHNGIGLSETTVRNLSAIGVDATDLAPAGDDVARAGIGTTERREGWGDPAGWRR